MCLLPMKPVMISEWLGDSLYHVTTFFCFCCQHVNMQIGKTVNKIIIDIVALCKSNFSHQLFCLEKKLCRPKELFVIKLLENSLAIVSCVALNVNFAKTFLHSGSLGGQKKKMIFHAIPCKTLSSPQFFKRTCRNLDFVESCLKSICKTTKCTKTNVFCLSTVDIQW